MAKVKATPEIDSIFTTMNEIYIECDENKKKIMDNWRNVKEKFPIENEDLDDESKLKNLQTVESLFIDSMTLLDKLIDKKIKVLTIHQKMLQSKNADAGDNTINAALTSADLNRIREEMKNANRKDVDDMSYDLKR